MGRIKTDKNRLIILLFALAVAVIIILPTITILNTPVEITKLTAGNFGCNLATGGYLLEDEGFLLYCPPQSRALYRAQTDDIAKTAVKIADDCDGGLQVIGSNYFYRSGNALIMCDWDGKNRKTVLEYAKSPLLVGGSVYYLDNDGSLCKYNNKYKAVTDYGVVPDGPFVYYYNAIYYVKGNEIRKLSVSSGADLLFFRAKAQSLFFDDKYLFYIEDGVAYSAIMTAEHSMISSKIVAAQSFAVIKDKMLYTDESGAVYYADLNKIVTEKSYTPKQLAKSGSGVAADENGFYFFKNGKTLCRIAADGSKYTEF